MAQSNEAAVETIATIIEIAIKLITVGENNFSTVAINMLPCVTVISSCDPKIPKITGMTEAAIKKKGWHDHSFTDCFFLSSAAKHRCTISWLIIIKHRGIKTQSFHWMSVLVGI
jgi:hypothetical protein